MSTGKIKQLAFSEGVTVGTPSEIAALAVGLASYASEAAFVSAEGTATVGDAFYDTGASAIKYYDGAWKTVASTAAALSNPMAAAGDMIYGGASGTPTNLATGGTAGLLHGGNGATPTWSKVVNADVDAAAAIAYTKLALSGSIVNADVSNSAAIDGSKLVAATNSVAGAVTTSAQSMSGVKTFYDGIKLDEAAGQDTLNYFREDTFTPVLEGSSTSGVGTYGDQIGKYTRIGNTVHFHIYVSWTTHTGTGNIRVADLPFTSANTTSATLYTSNVNWPASIIGFVAAVGSSSTKIDIYGLRDADTPVNATFAETGNDDASPTKVIIINGWYPV